jgi:ubiquinone/menaquinone biosynthesis C-methylase UbiE
VEKFSVKHLNEYYSDVPTDYVTEYDAGYFWEDLGKRYMNSLAQKQTDLEINVKFLLNRLNLIRPEKILEVGCGFGRCLAFVEGNKEGLGIKEVVGLEMSSTMIADQDKFFNLCSEWLKTRPKTVQGKAQEIPFKDQSFDCVYTHVVLTHIPPKDIPLVTKEISRVAKDWIIHIERYVHADEHSAPHRWTHRLVPYYLDLGWEVHEFAEIHKEHNTKLLVLKREDMTDILKRDSELKKQIDKVVNSGDIKKSREQQSAAEKLIRQRQDFRRKHGLDR